jgi:hypothetical protein
LGELAFFTIVEEEKTRGDIQVDEDGNIYLRSERSGQSTNGRLYTLTFNATDASGNLTTVEVLVHVPHNM